MVKPKKLSFPCVYCGKEFRKKASLDRHLLSHPGYASKSRGLRVPSNWCPLCQKSFSESESTLHMEHVHKFDNYKIPSGIDEENEYITSDLYTAENFFTVENIPSVSSPRKVDKISPTKVAKKRGRKPGKKVQTPSYSTRMKIKTEPPDTYETNKTTLENKKVASNSSSVVTCKLCGFKSKNTRGIKIHFSTIHKKKCEKGYTPKRSPYIHKIQKTATFIKQEPQDEDSNQDNNPTKTSSNLQPLFVINTVPNINQTMPTGVVHNNLQNQPFNNIIHIVNPSGVQNSSTVENQNPQDETIPKFDCDSENYIKWVKNFISRCKRHGYPLTPMLCQSISHINEEITDGLAKAEGSLKNRSNHFYFAKIRSTLSEIMMDQLRYSMNAVRGNFQGTE